MPVIRVDLGKAVFSRRRETESVGGAEIEGGRSAREGGFDAVEDGVGEREKSEIARRRVRLDL